MKPTFALSLIALALASAGLAETAAAEVVRIKSCRSDSGRFSTKAFRDAGTSGMLRFRHCNRGSEKGLVTRNRIRSKPVKRGAVAVFELRAAPGTEFSTYTWKGRIRRVDCRYTTEIYAVRPATPSRPRLVKPITGKTAGVDCPPRNRAQSSGSFGGVYDVRGTTRIVQRVICAGKRVCSARANNYVRTRQSVVKAVDTTAPLVSITGGDLVRTGWVSGARTVAYHVTDALGVKKAQLILRGTGLATDARPCDSSSVIPCASGPGTLSLDTAGKTPEGPQQIVVAGEDAAGNVGYSAPEVAYIDNTAPLAVPVAAEGGEGWRNTNGFAARWGNPPEPERAPISAAHYRLCRAGGPCREADVRRGGGIARLGGVEVPSPGDWTLRMWREDEAGNRSEGNASEPIRLRYDPEAPKVAFEPVAAPDPTLVAVNAVDGLSGVGGGQIEMSREGSGSWQGLRTALRGGRLEARIDDSGHPAGRYLLRARASDRAGNTAVTDRRSDGSVAAVTLPLRAGAALRGGFARARKGKRRGVRLKRAARVRRGRLFTVAGTVRGAGGGGLPGATVFVVERPVGGADRLRGTTVADSRGRYRYRLRATTSATIRLVYFGTPLISGAIRDLKLAVPARSSLRARRRTLLNGQAQVFRGRVTPRPGLSAGKLVELQTVLAGRWQTFRTVRANALGRWRIAYRFRRTSGTVRYRFRARLPREAGYPFATGHSRTIAVTVRGR